MQNRMDRKYISWLLGGFHWYDNPVIVILERFYTYETVYSYAKGTKSCSRLKCVWKVNLPTETSHNGS